MMSAWASLARDLKPTGSDDEWPRYNPATDAKMIRIDSENTLEAGYRADFCTFWANFQP